MAEISAIQLAQVGQERVALPDGSTANTLHIPSCVLKDTTPKQPPAAGSIGEVSGPGQVGRDWVPSCIFKDTTPNTTPGCWERREVPGPGQVGRDCVPRCIFKEFLLNLQTTIAPTRSTNFHTYIARHYQINEFAHGAHRSSRCCGPPRQSCIPATYSH